MTRYQIWQDGETGAYFVKPVQAPAWLPLGRMDFRTQEEAEATIQYWQVRRQSSSTERAA